jgi:tetratricopeptide (TPR) repeat protein
VRPGPATFAGRRPAPASTPLPPRHPRGTGAAPGAPPPAQDHLARAEAHYGAKRFAEALLAFDAALARSPGEPRALLGKARVLADCGEDFEALETLETLLHAEGATPVQPRPRAPARGGDHAEALALMALLLNKKGLTELAAGYLDQLARAAPEHPVLGLRVGAKPQGGSND